MCKYSVRFYTGMIVLNTSVYSILARVAFDLSRLCWKVILTLNVVYVSLCILPHAVVVVSEEERRASCLQ